MALNNLTRDLIRALADNKIKDAKGYAKLIVEKDTTQANKQFCENVKLKLETQEAKLIELPYNVKELLKLEDVSESFNENRYFLRKEESALFNKIQDASEVNEQLSEMGIRHLNSTLLHGESGTGKTTFGRYVAYKMGLPFIYLNFSQCVEGQLGATQKNLERIFNYIGSINCVLMLDEIDAIGLARGHSAEVGEMSRVVIALMQGLDLIGNEHIVLAATNRLDILDRALVRRFGILHEVEPLEEQEAIQLIQNFLNDVRIEYDDEDIEIYAMTHRKQSEIVNDITNAIVRMLKKENSQLSLIDTML